MDFPGTLSAEPRVYLDLLNGLIENFLHHVTILSKKSNGAVQMNIIIEKEYHVRYPESISNYKNLGKLC